MNVFLPTHGRWLRRRKNDGALNRVPPVFYSKVWVVLSQCEGISIGSEWLGTGVTKEKTAEEFSFGLEFEVLLDVVRDPAERQLVIDLLVVIYWMGVEGVGSFSGGSIDVLGVLRDAVESHWKVWVSHALPVSGLVEEIGKGFDVNEGFARRLFYDLPKSGGEGSNAWLAGAAGRGVFGMVEGGVGVDWEEVLCERVPDVRAGGV
jgi:hypothetical protein